MNTIDRWENENQSFENYYLEGCILSLIDLVRKKDRGLFALKLALENDDPDNELGYLGVVKETLALTEELK